MSTVKNKYSILVIDDDDFVLKSLSRLLRADDLAVSCYSDPMDALIQCTTRSFDLILSDQRMPGMTGTEFFAQVAELYPDTRRLLISGYSDFESVTDAFNDGIIHKFIVKPWNNQQLKSLIRQQLELDPAARSSVIAPTDLTPEKSTSHVVAESTEPGIVTEDSTLLHQLGVISKTARSEAPFFIHGETGTGKELVARAVHNASARESKPFVALNCANLTETLLESQLFGHRKGAFTGAERDQKGLLAEADGGTLFLDEVTELPLGLQAKLLRVLQEREYTPLGETRPVKFDVMVVSASSTSLEQAVASGDFREDLRYRLEVMPVHLPPLRARGKDKLLLFDHFLNNQMARHGREPIAVHRSVYSLIDSYHWPGNVREMVNVCTYVAALVEPDDFCIMPGNLPPVLRGEASVVSASDRAVQETTESLADKPSPRTVARLDSRADLERALEEFSGHREKIAEHFGISRMTLWRRMKEYEMA